MTNDLDKRAAELRAKHALTVVCTHEREDEDDDVCSKCGVDLTECNACEQLIGIDDATCKYCDADQWTDD